MDEICNLNDKYVYKLYKILENTNGNGMEQKRVFCKLRGAIREIEGISGVVDKKSYDLTEEVITHAEKKGWIERKKHLYLGDFYVLNFNQWLK